MKRYISFFLLLLLLLSFSGCGTSSDSNGNDSRPVIVRLPEDDSVNGYRIAESGNKSEMPDNIGRDEVIISTEPATDSTNEVYCLNVKSKVFHRPDCSSLYSMKEQNKSYCTDRQALIADGCTPCKRCNP